MGKYSNNYIKYENIVSKYVGSYEGLVEIVKSNIISKEPSITRGKAIVLHGFSGNGKTTWIHNFRKNNPNYAFVSMDMIVNLLYEQTGKKAHPKDIISCFDMLIEHCCSNGKNVIIDGNFLNLLTRMALVDTLHQFYYEVTLIDLTSIFEEIIGFRIMQKASEDIGTKITQLNLSDYVNDPRYIARKKEILDYHNKERENSVYEEQKKLDLLGLNVEQVIKLNSAMELEITSGKVR